ncbi:MAG: hypothetical protein R2734_00360 [Nocardioides sp.]
MHEIDEMFLVIARAEQLSGRRRRARRRRALPSSPPTTCAARSCSSVTG